MIIAALGDGNRYAKRDFGTPAAPALLSNTSADTKLGSSMRGMAVIP